MLLEHGGKTEVSDLLERCHVQPDIRFTTWEDFSIMVERGMGISILPSMILQRIPYRLEIRSMKEPYYRHIGLAMKLSKHLMPAARKFIEYLPFREKDQGKQTKIALILIGRVIWPLRLYHNGLK